jgi:hypothetical protein
MGGRTDRTILTVAFHKFANVPKNMWWWKKQYLLGKKENRYISDSASSKLPQLPYLEINSTEILNKQQQKVAVVEFLSQVSYNDICLRFSIRRSVQHILNLKQILANILLRLKHRPDKTPKSLDDEHFQTNSNSWNVGHLPQLVIILKKWQIPMIFMVIAP